MKKSMRRKTCWLPRYSGVYYPTIDPEITTYEH